MLGVGVLNRKECPKTGWKSKKPVKNVVPVKVICMFPEILHIGTNCVHMQLPSQVDILSFIDLDKKSIQKFLVKMFTVTCIVNLIVNWLLL